MRWIWTPVLLAIVTSGCAPDEGPPGVETRDGERSPAAFTDVTVELGLPEPGDWPDGTFAMPEIVGTGLALFDRDGDGDLDLLVVRMPPPGKPDQPAPDVLYEQREDGRFVDVTAASGLGDPGWGQGVAIGDVDNDGDGDVYLTSYGRDSFYVNDGDGTFHDATDAAGLGDDAWSTGAAFCDYDRDGDLDLYVAHYVDYDPKAVCKDSSGMQDYCDPRNFDGVADTLYRNEGDGTFLDVTSAAGVVLPDPRKAKGLGVVCTDLTGDGFADVYVANDGEPNQLWINRGDGTFGEQGIMRGIAVNRDGVPTASMGIAVGDIDGNHEIDLMVTNLRGENNTVFGPSGGGLYRDRTAEAGMAEHDLAWTGFGCGFFDYEHDGDLDVAVVNGRVYRDPVVDGARLSPFWNSYAEPNLLFENDGGGRFRPVPDRAGAFGSRVDVHRGLAMGDIDRDGDIDLAVSSIDGSVRVYRNDAPAPGSHWVQIRAWTGPLDAVGATVRVSAGGKSFTAPVVPSSSFLSQHDPRVHFGLGATAAIESIEVSWPDGSKERFRAEGVDRVIEIRQGEGEPL